MAPKLRIYLIEKATEIVVERGEKITAENISAEFNKLVELMDIPLIEEFEREITETWEPIK